MKIITITLNPAIDKTIYCDTFEVGETNRVKSTIEDVAGKGINVSKNLRVLGFESSIFGVFAGSHGERSVKELKEQSFEVHALMVEGQTRVNQKIVDKHGLTTELNESGPKLNEATLHDIKLKVEKMANEDVCFVISGSLPQGVSSHYYYELIEIIKAKQAKVVLDASGDALKYGVEAIPNVIKPNIDECQSLFGLDHKPNKVELIEGFKPFFDQGIELVCVSLGSKGALFLTKEQAWRSEGLDVVVKSSVGAGDAMVAGLTASLASQYSITELIKWSMAIGAAACETEGTKPNTLSRITKLKEQVNITKEEI